MKSFKILFLILFTAFISCEKTYYVEEAPIALADAVLGDDQLTIPEGFDFSSTQDQSIQITGNKFPADAQISFSLYQVVDTTATLIHKGFVKANEALDQSYSFPNHVQRVKIEASYGNKTYETELPKEELGNFSLDFDNFTNPTALRNTTAVKPANSKTYEAGDGVMAHNYTCPSSVTGSFTSSDTGTYTLYKNQTWKVTGSGIFRGSINNWENGTTILYICSGATWKPSSTSISNKNFKVRVLSGGTLDLSDVNPGQNYTFNWIIENEGTVKRTHGTLMPITNSKVYNWGTMIFNNLNSQGTFRNFQGTLSTNGYLTTNGGDFSNEGAAGSGAVINVGSYAIMNSSFNNYSNSQFNVHGNFTNNTAISNACSIFANNFTSNAHVTLTGEGAYIKVANNYTINNGNLNAASGTGNHLIQTKNLTSGRYITFNNNTNYSLLEVTGTMNFYSHNNRLRGNLYVCSSSYTANMGNEYVIADCSASVDASTCSPGYNSIPDTDGDGVYDDVDVEINNGDVATYNYPQGQGSYYTSVFEDLWPCKGDFDFNDLVTLYTFREGVSASSEVKELQFTLKIAAIGAANDNGFSLRVMGNATMNNESLDGVEYNRYYDSTNGTTVFTFTKFKAALSRVETSVINTVTSDFAEDDYLEISGKITSIDNGYDFFLTTDSDTAQELHPLSGNVGTAAALTKPTDRMDTSLMNTCWDTSNTTGTGYDHTGQYFLDADGMAWGMIIPTPWAWPKEKNSILSTYTNLEDYVESSKSRSTDWYMDTSENINNSKVFRHYSIN